MREVILYRGPLERARLKLIIQSVLFENSNKVDFVWIFPNILPEERKKHFEAFISEFNINNVYIFNDRGVKYFNIKKEIKRLYINQSFARVHYVGFSSWMYSTTLISNSKVWYVNGVPEEGQLHKTDYLAKVKSFIQWKLNIFFKQPTLTVTVSRPMTSLIRSYVYRTGNYIEVPITSDTAVFKNKRTVDEKKYLTYLGTGAPWQALDKLSGVWYSLYQIDNNLKFRVISRDERTKVLGEKLPSDSIEFVGSNDFNRVSSWLSEAKMGFLIRRENVVNEVAFPTKFAEYTASGALVALSELKWDLTSYLKNHDAGVLVPVNMRANEAAKLIYTYLQDNKQSDYLNRLEAVSSSLSNEYWIPILSRYLRSI